ncbi:MAG: hypothetical protein P9X24_09980 [Candidatus Hatepunaea meridiana]|nr:hypothetical protein [Candidatus Hatepunaea meridiana]
MRCQHCKGSISAYNFFKEKHCPACGEKLKRIPTKEKIKETFISFAEDKGYIFWSIVYIFVIYVVSFFEQIFGTGALFDYASDHWIRFYFLAFWSGSIIDYIIKANVEITSVRNKYIFRPPLYLRRFRNNTNLALIVGLGFSVYLLHRYPDYLSTLPMFTFITTFVVCLAWAIMGIFITEDDMNDKLIRYYMKEMRVERVKKYNRASATYIGGIFIATAAYCWLVNISGLWWYIYNSRFVYDLIKFFRDYFSWVSKFVD